MRYVDRQPGAEAIFRDVNDPDPRVRVQAAGALGAVPDEHRERARQALRERLNDDSGDIRYAAALSLGELKDVDALDDLVAQLQGDGHPLARQGAVIALALLGDERALPPLLEALSEGPPDVRFQATTSLAQLSPRAALQPLKKALSDDDPEVRASAAAALATVGDPKARPALARALEDLDPRVQLEAAVALAHLDDPRGSGILVEALRRGETREVGAENLYRCPDPARETAMRWHLARWRTPPQVKVWLAGALARLNHPDGRRSLLKLLYNRRPAVRGLVIQLLGELSALPDQRDPWARRALEELKAHPAGKGWEEEITEALGSPKST